MGEQLLVAGVPFATGGSGRSTTVGRSGCLPFFLLLFGCAFGACAATSGAPSPAGPSAGPGHNASTQQRWCVSSHVQGAPELNCWKELQR